MIIDEVFEFLIGCGIVQNQCEFSRKFLGRSARYYSYLLATKSEPPVEVLVALSIRLRWIGEAEAERCGSKIALRLCDLSDQLREDAVRQAIVTSPRKRAASRLPA